MKDMLKRQMDHLFKTPEERKYEKLKMQSAELQVEITSLIYEDIQGVLSDNLETGVLRD